MSHQYNRPQYTRRELFCALSGSGLLLGAGCGRNKRPDSQESLQQPQNQVIVPETDDSREGRMRVLLAYIEPIFSANPNHPSLDLREDRRTHYLKYRRDSDTHLIYAESRDLSNITPESPWYFIFDGWTENPMTVDFKKFGVTGPLPVDGQFDWGSKYYYLPGSYDSIKESVAGTTGFRRLSLSTSSANEREVLLAPDKVASLRKEIQQAYDEIIGVFVEEIRNGAKNIL